MTVKIKAANREESPTLFNAIMEAAANCAGESVEYILDQTGAHPVIGITAMIDCLSSMLRQMDRKAANVILRDIAHERTNVAAQSAASQALLVAYEAQCDAIEHEEGGGLLS